MALLAHFRKHMYYIGVTFCCDIMRLLGYIHTCLTDTCYDFILAHTHLIRCLASCAKADVDFVRIFALFGF